MKKIAKMVIDRGGVKSQKTSKKSTDYVVNFMSKIESFLNKIFTRKSRDTFSKSETEEGTMLNIDRSNQKFWIIVLTILSPIFMLELRSYDQLKRQNMRMINTLAMLPDKIINIGYAKFYVPNYPIDIIQSEIVDKWKFFEEDILRELQRYIKKNAVILDIGANIGNHSVYWAVRSNAKRIYSFEPIKDTFKILKKNVEINELSEKIKIFNIGLSDKKINGSVSLYVQNNIGGIHVKQNENGTLLLEKLDNIKIAEDVVDFVKIDVEGHEFQVLQGAEETLKKYKPTIFVEIFPDNKQKVHEFLINLGYRLEKSFTSDNYLYLFDGKK